LVEAGFQPAKAYRLEACLHLRGIEGIQSGKD
jgi:hypothetical protein